MGFPRVWSIVVALSLALGGAALVTWTELRLLRQSGLEPVIGSPDGEGERAVTASEWRGYLIFPDRTPRRLIALAPAEVELFLDGDLVLETAAGRNEARVQRPRGLHAVLMRTDRPVKFPKLLWADALGTPVDVPPLLLVSRIVPYRQIERRISVAGISRLVPFVLSLVLLAGAAGGGWAVLRRMFGPGIGTPWAWAAVATLFATAIWWGMPDPIGWAADELTPADVREALAVRFGNGWATLYPPLHFAVLAFFQLPFYVCAAAGTADFTDLGAYSWLFITSRLVSLAMALGIVAMVFGLAREIAGRRAAWWATGTLVVALPLTYYAKTANLDVPYVFWVTLSMVFFSRAVGGGAARDYYLFAAAGTVAISTKDQAFAFFVLPAALMLAGRFLRGIPPQASPAPRVLAGMAAIVVGGGALLQNVAFNPGGFVEHVRIMVGPGSEGFRMFPPGPGGQARLLGVSVRLVGDSMSWPLFVAALAGIAGAARARMRPILRLLLPIASYYVFLIAVVGYVYDRFFLGVIVLLAIPAGWWLDRWTRAGVQQRRLRLGLVAAAFVYAGARVVALDVLMVRDSRYAVERWLLTQPAAGARISAAGMDRYLPRRYRVFWEPMQQDVAELAGRRPDYVVVNAGFSSRRSPESRRHEMYDALRAGNAGYDLALRHRTELWWSPLNLEPRFSGADQEPFSNLTKINPVIEVYRRRGAPIRATSSSPPPSSRPPSAR